MTTMRERLVEGLLDKANRIRQGGWVSRSELAVWGLFARPLLSDDAGLDELGRGTVSIDIFEVFSGGPDRKLTDLIVVSL